MELFDTLVTHFKESILRVRKSEPCQLNDVHTSSADKKKIEGILSHI